MINEKGNFNVIVTYKLPFQELVSLYLTEKFSKVLSDLDYTI